MTEAERAGEILRDYYSNPNYEPNKDDCLLVINQLNNCIDLFKSAKLPYYTEFLTDSGMEKDRDKFREMLSKC